MLKTKEHECKEITPTPLYNTADKVLNLMQATLKEAKFIIMMDLNVILFIFQITYLIKIEERNEYLLLHAFCMHHLKDYIILNKKIEKKTR